MRVEKPEMLSASMTIKTDPQRSLPTPTILWFCDSVISELYFNRQFHWDTGFFSPFLLSKYVGKFLCPEIVFTDPAACCSTVEEEALKLIIIVFL